MKATAFLILNFILPIFNFNSAYAFLGPSEFYRIPEIKTAASDPTGQFNLSIFSLGLGMACTGTLISKRGHVLLASHCIEDQIQFQFKPQVPIRFFKSEKINSELELIHFNVDNITSYLEVPVRLDNKVSYARITAVGKGLSYPRFVNQAGPAIKGQVIKFVNEGYSLGGDFAILQLPALAGKSCYRFAEALAKEGDKVHSTSFACSPSERRPWPDFRTSTIVEYSQNGHETKRHLGGYSLYIPRGGFLLNFEAWNCNSGSAILNTKNQIIGVLNSVAGQGNQARTMALSTSRMLELMPVKTASLIKKMNKECDR